MKVPTFTLVSAHIKTSNLYISFRKVFYSYGNQVILYLTQPLVFNIHLVTILILYVLAWK